MSVGPRTSCGASEFDSLGRIPVLKALMNADLHMASEPKNTDKGNLALTATLEGQDRPERVGLAPQRNLAPVRPPQVGPDRREGHQPPRRRGDEGVPEW